MADLFYTNYIVPALLGGFSRQPNSSFILFALNCRLDFYRMGGEKMFAGLYYSISERKFIHFILRSETNGIYRSGHGRPGELFIIL